MHTRHLRLIGAACVLVCAALAVGFVFAGSQNRLAEGITIAGVDVGGMTRDHAVSVLEARSRRLAGVPVTFATGSQRFAIRPEELGVEPDWRATVAAAASRGDGFAVVRGYQRLVLRFNPEEFQPTINAYDAAVAYEVGLLATKIDKPHVEARLVRHGLEVVAVHGQTGRLLDRVGATRVIVDALAGFSRKPVQLPVRTDAPRITVADLAHTRTLANRILSAPVELDRGSAGIAVSAKQLARMLLLPEGLGEPAIGGPAANRYFSGLDHKLAQPARDASFSVDGGVVTVVPSRPGIAIDVARTAASVLAAAERRFDRTAQISEAVVQPKRTTAQAKAMGITGVVGSYETFFGGIPNRIHNVELVAHLIDNTFVAPGATFSFNGTTGERSAAKGFVEAPVIINGELQTALGGGVCQVSTTTFNAAYEAGLPITARTNHALYISHYPLGRDATVNYPDTDLKFVNDTPHWILVRTFVTYSSLVVNLYGAPQHRRVVSEAAPLELVSPPPVERRLDKTLAPGTTAVQDPGESAYRTSVHRLVYAPGGKLLSDATWYSNYTASPEVLLVGPKPKPKPKAKPKPPATTTTPAETTPVGRSGRALQ